MLLNTTKQLKDKNFDGVDQELYDLIGGVPPISINKKSLKQKADKEDKWECKGFTSSARDDDLILHHWTKVGEETADFHFAQFNKIVDLVDYSEEDYQQYLTQENWTKEETDYLFELCQQYDLRFVVIADRYSFSGVEKSMEDMKERYYSVTSKMLAIRAARGEKINQERILSMSFDKDKETQRKRNLIQLYDRDRAQIEAEESLYFESLRLEQNERNLYKERENHLLLFNAKELHIPKPPVEEASTTASPNPLAFPEGVFKSKKKKVLVKKDAKPLKEHIADPSPSVVKDVVVVKQEPGEISTPLKPTFPKSVVASKATPIKTVPTPEC
ncbi:swr complex subunit, variant 2 [Basidiobolus ranarum]|uniref:SWR1-complex protein 4 n=1 Tax=Basidiobolus ranarum TaxID=34480 RepID=A0ABR2W9H4_9FUNG